MLDWVFLDLCCIWVVLDLYCIGLGSIGFVLYWVGVVLCWVVLDLCCIGLGCVWICCL